MKKIFALTVVGLAIGLNGGLINSAQAAQPKTSFKHIVYDDHHSYYHYTAVAYHAKRATKNAYIWNNTHTKKLYNLKSFPTYTWFLTATGTYKGNHNWIQVTNTPGTKTGWIYRPQLVKGFNPKGYQITHRRFLQPTYAGDYYHVTSATKNAYLWDWTHTKKRLNLKNYTNQNLYRSNSVQISHNGKTSWYYYVGVPKNGQTIYGYVPSSAVTAGKTTNHSGRNLLFPDDFVSTKDYVHYLNDSKYQKLARSMVKLFPNTPVDLGLSRIAAYNYATNDTWDEDAPEAISTKGYTKIVPFTSVATYLMNHKTQTNTQKLAAIKKLLAKQGYPQSKRTKLSDYKLGIYVINNVMGGRTNEDGSVHKGNWYGLIIGQKD